MDVSSSSSISLRKATPQDAAAIAKLGVSVFTTAFAHSVTPQQLQNYLDEAYSLEATLKDISDPQKDLILAIDNQGAVRGFALLTRGTTDPCVEDVPDRVELQRLYVDTAAHGTGIGRRLATEIERIAREQGFNNMWLGVWEENHVAQKVYKRLGYVPVGNHGFNVGGDIQTDIIMLKAL